MTAVPTMRRLLKLRYSGHSWKPHRWVLSRAVWEALQEEYRATRLSAGDRLLDWPVTISDVVPDDYIGVEKA